MNATKYITGTWMARAASTGYIRFKPVAFFGHAPEQPGQDGGRRGDENCGEVAEHLQGVVVVPAVFQRPVQ